jgi:hypothetical protein
LKRCVQMFTIDVLEAYEAASAAVAGTEARARGGAAWTRGLAAVAEACERVERLQVGTTTLDVMRERTAEIVDAAAWLLKGVTEAELSPEGARELRYMQALLRCEARPVRATPAWEGLRYVKALAGAVRGVAAARARAAAGEGEAS